MTRFALPAICSCILLATGCASDQRGPTRAQRVAALKSARNATNNQADLPAARAAEFSDSMYVRAAVLPLGAVPNDDVTLPLVSPDGQFIVTQTGISPTWEAVLAEPDAPDLMGTRIEIYQLDRRELADPRFRLAPELFATVDEPVVLGRSCDDEGFIVESMREDGSRWIGKASWLTGKIDWLVADENVNAFAALGPAGRLAWSRRAVDAERFHLVARTGAGDEWALEYPGSDWLLPQWSGNGDNLFVMHLSGGTLEARFGNASSAANFRHSMRSFRIVDQADAYVAYQTLAAQAAVCTRSASSRGGRNSDHLLYFHPSLNRACIWRPLASPGRKAMHLNKGSLAALIDETPAGSESEYVFVTTRDQLLRQNIASVGNGSPIASMGKIDLVAGMRIPRATPASEWPYVLLSPGEGVIGVTAMTLLPIESASR